MRALIEAERLTKNFGKIRALDGLDLTIPAGEVWPSSGPTERVSPRSSEWWPPSSDRMRVGCVSPDTFLVFPLTFVSSAYVPVSTMPGWMQAFAEHQPLTYMSDSVRILTGGHGAELVLGQTLGTCLPVSLLWTAGIVVVLAPFTVWRLRRS